MPQTLETRLSKEIRLWCGQNNWLVWHCNVGGGKLENGSYFSTGLPRGFPDLLILTDKGQAIFCECKVHPNKPTLDQINFINNLKQRGFKAFVAYTLEEFIENARCN